MCPDWSEIYMWIVINPTHCVGLVLNLLIDCLLFNIRWQIFHEYSWWEQFNSLKNTIQKWRRNGTTWALIFDCNWKSMEIWVGTKNYSSVVTTMCLLILEIYKRGVYDGVSLALSKNIAHYALHSGFLHYYLESLDWDNNVEFYYLKSVLLKRGVLWCQWHTVVPCIPIRLIQNCTSFSNKKM
jgi:hypothetical protein